MNKVSNWLVQRVSKPKDYVNPFNNTDKAAQTTLMNVISFDYMGAAEYEHGAVNECLSDMWEGELNFHKINIPGKYNDKYKMMYLVVLKGTADSLDDILTAITEVLYKGKGDDEVSKADYGSYYRALTETDKRFIPDTKGWINLKHRFAWFIDKEMAHNFANHLNQIEE